MASSRANEAASGGENSTRLPKAIVFDLDGCIWRPEMYELWGGGAPFELHNDGEILKDRSGQKVYLLGDVRSILHELKTHPKWTQTAIGVASSCDEPSWARECIQKFSIGSGYKLKDVLEYVEIYKTSKTTHLRAISKSTGVDLKDILFFDNEYGNCKTVASIGVTVMYTPDDGVTRANFSEALDKFPAPGEVLGPKPGKHW